MRGRRQAVEIVFDHVTKRYPGRAAPAVDDLSLDDPRRRGLRLVGPSGGGKTTAMKMVNRLIELTSGDIRIDGRSVKGARETELRRGIGYVIQQIGLFPHMTVAENIATVPRLLGWDKAGSGHASTSCSTWSTCDRELPSPLRRRSSPAASASGSGWRARSRPTRR